METPIKTYYESKKRALAYGLIIYVALGAMVFDGLSSHASDIVFTSYLVKYSLSFTVAFGILIYFYPVGVLELYKDKFVYKKGNFFLSSGWTEVIEIAFQYQHPRGGIGAEFFIDTTSGITKLIDTKILKHKDTNKAVDFMTFIQELEQVSGKVIKVGEISTKKYSKATLRDYMQGVKNFNKFWK